MMWHGGDTPSRGLLLAVGLAAAGALGAWPVRGAGADPVRAAAWLSLWAAPAGALAAGYGLRLLAVAVPAAWAGLSPALGAATGRPLPTPLWAALAIAGLFATGYGIGVTLSARSGRAAAVLLLAGATLAALPTGAGVTATAPWGPRTTARLLDVSPVSLVLECAGVDWMRHPAIYAAARTDRIGPDLRLPWRGFLAGPTVLLLGCVLALGGASLGRRAGGAPPRREE